MMDDTLWGMFRGKFSDAPGPNDVWYEAKNVGTVPQGVAQDLGFTPENRRFITSHVANGDFAATPPDTSATLSDRDNKLPEWSTTNHANVTMTVTSTSAGPSGWALKATLSAAGATDEGYEEQLIPVNGSSDRSYAYGLAAYVSANSGAVTAFLRGQFLKSDLTTTGSAVTSTNTLVSTLKLSMGSIPADAYWLRLQIGARNGTGSATFSEVREHTGPELLLLVDRQTPANVPGLLLKDNGDIYLSPFSTSGAAVDTAQPYLKITSAGVELRQGTVTTAWTDSEGFTLSQAITLSAGGTISPAQLTADTNNWNPTGLGTASVIRASSDAARNLTGIAAQEAGRLVYLCNVGANNIVLKHADAGSSAANRFSLPSVADVTIAQQGSATIWYDGTDSRWRLLNKES